MKEKKIELPTYYKKIIETNFPRGIEKRKTIAPKLEDIKSIKDKKKQFFEHHEHNDNDINVEIKENNEEVNKGGNVQINLEDIKIITQKDDSNKNENGVIGKKNMLPGVGVKNDNFVVSKAGEGENLDEININVDNLKSVSVGINGQKTGNRVDVDN